MINPEAQKVMATLNKKLGGDVLVVASDITEFGKRVTTGSVTFDYILGGGWPVNQWHELVGEQQHGKSYLAMKTIAANQAKDPDWTAVWVAAEPWVADWAIACGVDPDRVIVVETTIMEEAYDAAIAFAESKSVDCIVIDSLPALTPSPEVAKDMDEMTVGRGALLTNKFFRKVGAAMQRSLTESERPIIGIMINQWRFKIGVMHGDPRTTPGGVGKDYAYFTRTEVKRDEWIEIGPSGNKKRIGQSMRLRTLKNKAAPPQRVAFIDMYFDEGGIVSPGEIDTAKEIVAMAMVKEIITRKGSYYYYKDQQWQGKDAILEAVREDLDLADELTNLVLTTTDDPRTPEEVTA
jgi:recombination protein RecA